MHKNLTVILFVVLLLIYGCNKEEELDTLALDNSTPVVEIKTHMIPYETELTLLEKPLSELLYNLIDKGVNTQTDQDIKIPYPANVSRIVETPKEFLIKKGATPLGISALICNPLLLNLLLDAGADPKMKINGMDPAAYILQCGTETRLGMLKSFLQSARNIENVNKEKYNTPESLSANALIKDSIDYHKDHGQSLLSFATINGLIDSVSMLVNFGADINYRNINDPVYNKLPMLVALEYNRTSIFNYFLQQNGNLLMNQGMQDGTNITLLDIFFYNGSNFISRVNPIPRVFMKSIFESYDKKAKGIDEIKLLTESNINQITKKEMKIDKYSFPIGTSAPHIAAYFGYDNIIKGLSLVEADFNIIDSQGNTPLMIAASLGNAKTVKVLLEAGADPNITNKNGNSPLITTLKSNINPKNKLETIKIFVNSLINLRIKNKSGQTAFSLIDRKNPIYNTLVSKDTNYRNPYINKITSDLINNGNYISNIILTLLRGDINNQLPFPITNIDGLIFPKGSTPLIIASLSCDDKIVESLILLKADDKIKVNIEGNMLDAYGIADKYGVGDCEKVKSLLTNYKNVVPDPVVVNPKPIINEFFQLN